MLTHWPSPLTALFPNCSRHESRSLPLVPVNFKILGRRGIKDLQAAIEDGLHVQPAECHHSVDSSADAPRCDGVVTHTYATGEALFVEFGTTQQFMLNQFPVNIMLQQEQFTLRGIVAFRPGRGKNTLGHYEALCQRSSCRWEEYDDLAKNVTMACYKSVILPHVVIYTKDWFCSTRKLIKQPWMREIFEGIYSHLRFVTNPSSTRLNYCCFCWS